jgi:hypothetical protein
VPLRRSQPEESTSRCGVFPRSRPPALTVGLPRSSHLGSRSDGPPYLVAGFQSRSVPPAPFLTTLAASASSGPVECFIHSRPWGSAPCSPMPGSGRQTRRPVFPGLVRVMRTKGACHTNSGGECSLSRVPVDSAPDSCRNSHPNCEVTAPPPEGGGPVPAPSHVPAPSPYPDHRSGHSSGCRSRYLHDRSRGLPGHRDGEPSRPFGPFPCGGCLSCSCQPRPGFPVHCRPRRATNPCGRPPEGDRRSEPACATDLGRLSTTRPLATCQLHSDFSLPLPREWSRVTGVAGDEDSKSICGRKQLANHGTP